MDSSVYGIYATSPVGFSNQFSSSVDYSGEGIVDGLGATCNRSVSTNSDCDYLAWVEQLYDEDFTPTDLSSGTWDTASTNIYIYFGSLPTTVSSGNVNIATFMGGNIGIGTTDPSDYTLVVNGDLMASDATTLDYFQAVPNAATFNLLEVGNQTWITDNLLTVDGFMSQH